MDDFDQEEVEEGGESWLMTFADLSQLLLVFFILLYSLSSLDKAKFQMAAEALGEAFQGEVSSGGRIRFSRNEDGLILQEAARFRQLIQEQRKVYETFQSFSVQKGMKGIVGAVLDKGKIILRLPSSVLFDPGKVTLKPKGKRVLKDLKDFFILHPDQKINIRGHTDNVPLKPGSRIKDNWELSALRAINVLRYLLRLGINAERLTATGLADLQPLYPNNSPANRARNRRVEFILEKMIK
jgi:chemotaxis protein MotB